MKRSLESGEKYAQIKNKTKQFKSSSKPIHQRLTFVEESNIMDYGLLFWPEVMVYSLNGLMVGLFCTYMPFFTSQDVNW